MFVDLASTYDLPINHASLGLDIRFGTADVLLQLQQTSCELDVVFEVVLCVQVVSGLVACVLLDVQTNGSATAACARQAYDDAAAIIELDEDTLVLADAAVKIGVREVVGLDNLAAGDG